MQAVGHLLSWMECQKLWLKQGRLKLKPAVALHLEVVI